MSTTRCVETLRQAQAGFSIIELMIVITIIGVLAGFAIPSFNEMIANNRRTTVVNELLSNVMLARAEAAKRGQTVSICANTNGGGLSCTGGGNWDYGWMVFLDPNADGAIASTNDVITIFKNDYSGITIRSSQGGGPVIVRPFNQRADDFGFLLICDKRGIDKSRRVCVEKSGRARVSETACDTADTQSCPP